MSEPPVFPNRLLIVDDSANNIAFLFDSLQALGYKLRVARDGYSALEKAACEPPDLILLDVMMPGIDGFETCKQLKANPDLQGIPVIFMTGMGEVEDKVKGFEAGGVDYLVKPVRLAELRARLTTHLKLTHLQQHLQQHNRELAAEVERRQQVEAALRETQAGLEYTVAQRTEELRAANGMLAQKIQALELAEADLQQALLAAEAASEAKSQFLAKMSHELRTPLNAILGFSQLLAGDPDLLPQHQQQLSIIAQSGSHLLRLIEDILSVAQFESGTSTYVCSQVELEPWLQDLIAPFRAQARTQGLTCQLVLGPQLPRYISTDATKLQQVLWHLLDNALKFSTTGGATLRVDWQSESRRAGQVQLEFAITDTGPGLDPQALQQWAEPFAQTRPNRRPLEGTGMGLTIAQHSVKLLGGELQVTSQPGQGSCFWFGIPVACPAGTTAQGTHQAIAQTYLCLAPDQPAYSLLVATLEPVTRRRLYEFLVPLGFQVELAPEPEQLVSRWQAVQPQLLILEAGSGIRAAIAAFRQAEAQEPTRQSPTPIVALLPESAATLDLTDLTAVATLPLAWSEPALLETLGTCLGARYLSQQPTSADGEPLASLQVADLQALSPDWLQALQDAILVVDDGRVRQVIAALGPEHATQQQQLLVLVEDFRFDLLLELVQGALERVVH